MPTAEQGDPVQLQVLHVADGMARVAVYKAPRVDGARVVP
jgi:hypothetical protein